MKIMQSIINQFVVYAATNQRPVVPDAFNQVITWLIGISSGLAVVGASICLIRIMISDEPRDISDAKSDLKQVLAAWLAISMLGGILQLTFSLVGYMNY